MVEDIEKQNCLTQYEKENGILQGVSFDTFSYKYIIKNNRPIIICCYKNCLKEENCPFNICYYHYNNKKYRKK